MDETEHEGVRILGASEAASVDQDGQAPLVHPGSIPNRPSISRPAASRPAANQAGAPSAASWDDDDEGWDDDGWLATDGDLDSDDHLHSRETHSLHGYSDDEDNDDAGGGVWAGTTGPDGADPDELSHGSGQIEDAADSLDSSAAMSSTRTVRFEDDESHDDGRESWSAFATKGPRRMAPIDDGDDDNGRSETVDATDLRRSDANGFVDADGSNDSKGGSGRRSPRRGSAVSGRAGARRPPQRSSADDLGPRQPSRPALKRTSSMTMRVMTGVGLLAIFLATLVLFKQKGAVALVALVAVLAVFEFYTSLRQRGFQPALLPGALATFLLPIAAYSEGSAGIVIVLFVATITTLLWYLFGVVRDRPAVNMAVTLLGILYIGVLAGTAGLFLANQHGVGILIGCVVGTITYDIVGFFVGSNIGRRPLAPDISPNKTIEGLAFGVGAAFVACVALSKILVPWKGSTSVAVALGLVVAVMAPLGDLTESMIKRDLGIKDMGSLLPGHGGILDRVDAMLFTVPAVYCIARWQGWA